MAYLRLQVRKRPPGQTGAQIRKSRREGRVPAVVSRRGKPSLEITTNLSDLQSAAHHTGIGGIVMLVDEETGEEHLGLLKNLQWNPLSKRILHAGFQEVNAQQVVQTSVPILFHGEPEQVTRHEAQLIKATESIDITAKVKDLPTAIGLDISGLVLGDVVTAKDVVLPEGCEATHPDTVICSVTTVKVVAPEEEMAVAAEEPEQPELVGQRGKQEEEESAE